MNDLNDSREQFRLHRKQMHKHLKDCFIYNLTNRKKVYFKRLLTLVGFLSFFGSGYLFYLQATTAQAQPVFSEIVYVSDSTKTMDAFLEKLGKIESGGNYRITNQFGFMGKFQLGTKALRQIGLGSVSKEQFLNNPELQDVAVKMLLKENKRILSSFIGKYQSRVIKGIYITESSILAASHLCPKGAMDFLRSNGDTIFKDGNGVPITKYFKDFSGYSIKLD